jgi:hypothetical protein
MVGLVGLDRCRNREVKRKLTNMPACLPNAVLK